MGGRARCGLYGGDIRPRRTMRGGSCGSCGDGGGLCWGYWQPMCPSITMEAIKMATRHFYRALLFAALVISGPANAGWGWFRSQDELKYLAKYHECLENPAAA
jgi:hypothetical protein